MSKLILSSKYKVLATCAGLGMLSAAFANDFQDNSSQSQSFKTLIDGIQKCPDTVTVMAKAYGLIVLDWSKYAPDVNAYITVTVVPHTVGVASRVASDTNNRSTLTLDGYTTGAYTVYYTLQPASVIYKPCTGMESQIVFL